MRKFIKKFKKTLFRSSPRLNPKNPEERKKIIDKAVDRAAKEYREALKRLGSE